MSTPETLLASVFSHTPHIPPKGREVIAILLPWIFLIYFLLSAWALFVYSVFAIAGIRKYGIPISQLSRTVLEFAGIAAPVAIGIFAVLPLFDRRRIGWVLLFYGGFLYAILLAVIFNGNELIKIFLNLLIGFWILFEIRDLFTKKENPYR